MQRRHARPGIGRPVLLAALLAGAGIVAAQNRGVQPAGTDEDLPRYTVELIVFTYAGNASGASEIFVPEAPPDPYAAPEAAPRVFGDPPSAPLSAPANDAAVVETESEGADGGMEDAEISGVDQDLSDIPLRARIELHRLAPEQYGMNEIYEKLVELDAYRPIMRAAWTQTTTPRDAAPEIRLRALGDPPPGLDGTVQLYQGRFVHLGLDIALDAAGAALPDERQSATDRAIAGSARANDGSADARRSAEQAPAWSDRPFGSTGDFVTPPVRYRITEARIMKNGEIRYYDHPRFGVIARLTEVEQEEPEAADDGALAGAD